MKHISDGIAGALRPSWIALYGEPAAKADASATALADICESHPTSFWALREFVRVAAISDELSIRMMRAARMLVPPRKQRIW